MDDVPGFTRLVLYRPCTACGEPTDTAIGSQLVPWCVPCNRADDLALPLFRVERLAPEAT